MFRLLSILALAVTVSAMKPMKSMTSNMEETTTMADSGMTTMQSSSDMNSGGSMMEGSTDSSMMGSTDSSTMQDGNTGMSGGMGMGNGMDNTGMVLQKNVMSIVGNQATQCDPIEYSFVNKNHELMNKEMGNDTPMKVASKVASTYSGYDDSHWYIDMSGKAMRMHYNGSFSALPVVSGMKFVFLAPSGYDITWAVSDKGDVCEYIGMKWAKTPTEKNMHITSLGLGEDGFLLAADHNASKIYRYDYESRKWMPYEKQGIAMDVADMMHVVVITGKDHSVEKKSGKQWTKVTDKCMQVSAFDSEHFYCVTPSGDLKMVPF